MTFRRLAASPNVYRYHVANLREVQAALKNVSLLARATIARRGHESDRLRSLVSLYALLLGCWAETRLMKLLSEPGAFNDHEVTEILGATSQLSKWKELVDLSFRKHCKLQGKKLTRISLGVANYARREILHQVLYDDVAIVIQIRNKLAHGQWMYPLNEGGTTVNADYCNRLRNENIQSLQFKFALLGHLADLTHDLAVSPETFERDFDAHFRKLEQARTNLKKRPYSTYVDNLVARRNRHRARQAQ